VNPARVTVEGRAAREPVATNDDPAGRARNRRVEIYVSEPAQQG
jgi:flagellar motor protein MotB